MVTNESDKLLFTSYHTQTKIFVIIGDICQKFWCSSNCDTLFISEKSNKIRCVNTKQYQLCKRKNKWPQFIKTTTTAQFTSPKCTVCSTTRYGTQQIRTYFNYFLHCLTGWMFAKAKSQWSISSHKSIMKSKIDTDIGAHCCSWINSNDDTVFENKSQSCGTVSEFDTIFSLVFRFWFRPRFFLLID